MINPSPYRRGGRPALMGILNVTPDSFSDGGRWNSLDAAREHVFSMLAHGADMIDVGGESTRPGATPVSEEDELSRVIPALKAFAGSVSVPISVDTMKASVARASVEAGATIINDVSSLADPLMAETAAELDVPIILMNSFGTSGTFKTEFMPGDGIDYVITRLQNLVDRALDAGVKENNIILDPGLGFGTTTEQCMNMVRHSSVYSLGKYPVLIGPSRKRFVKEVYSGRDVDEATADVCVLAAQSGADILRVHNVACVARRFA